MADNTAKIAEIREILESGVSSTTIDGVSATIDRDSLRQELRRLEAEDSAAQTKRPVASSIYLGGF